MPHADFVHLRVHSAYSLSEGAIKADKIAALARDAGMPAVAITDSGNLFGALEFSQSCTSKGIQPIIGCQIALARADNPRLAPDPLVLLAQNAEGLANLQRLSSRAFLESDPGLKPQLPFDVLAENAGGLILLTGGTLGADCPSAGGGSEAGCRAPAGADGRGLPRPRDDGTAPSWPAGRAQYRAGADHSGGRRRRAAGRHQ